VSGAPLPPVDEAFNFEVLAKLVLGTFSITLPLGAAFTLVYNCFVLFDVPTLLLLTKLFPGAGEYNTLPLAFLVGLFAFKFLPLVIG
jgi:hypothetical protein